jgi:large subunit ribosomal protein L21
MMRRRFLVSVRQVAAIRSTPQNYYQRPRRLWCGASFSGRDAQRTLARKYAALNVWSTFRAFTTYRYATVDHGMAYDNAMASAHGQQLSLAELEGVGKDDAPFDPFWEEEVLLEKKQQALDTSTALDHDSDDDIDEELDGDEDDVVARYKSLYNSDGSLRRPKSELAILRAGAPAGGIFAVIALAGSQHKVTTDDVLIVNRLLPTSRYAVGTVHTLEDRQVLLVSSTHTTCVGLPYVGQGAQVDFMIEEITKDAKVIIFKRRRRRNYRRKKGFRRDITMIRILDIRFPTSVSSSAHVPRRLNLVDELEEENNDEVISVKVTPGRSEEQTPGRNLVGQNAS